MKLVIDVWRQEHPSDPGHYETHEVDDAAPEMSILELLDRLNDQLVEEGREPVAFESDCREGICGVPGGTAQHADALPVTHEQAERALDMAACIGCGACVAACPNGAAHLFVGSKLAHLSLLPTGRLQRGRRARAMLAEMEQDFGPCSLYGECSTVCPADIPLTAIAVVNKEGLRSALRRKDD